MVAAEVTLPADYKPKFPPLCVVCQSSPDSTAKIAHNSQNPFISFFFPISHFFGWSRVEFPVCSSCKWKFRLQRWSRELITFAIVIACVWIFMPYFKGWGPTTRKIAVGALCIAVLLPYLLIEIYWPRFFETTARKDSIDYEFADGWYAAQFYAANHTQVLDTNMNKTILRFVVPKTESADVEDDEEPESDA